MDSVMPLPINQGGAVAEDEQIQLLKPVIGAFDAPDGANQAYQAVLDLGYDHNEVTVVMSEETRQRFIMPSPITDPTIAADVETHDDVEKENSQETVESKKVLGGAGAMSAVGAIGGALAGLTLNAVAPGVGLLIAGPLAGLGAGFGALIGGIYGVPSVELDNREKIEQFEEEVKAGKVIIHVVPRTIEDAELIRSAWRRIESEE